MNAQSSFVVRTRGYLSTRAHNPNEGRDVDTTEYMQCSQARKMCLAEVARYVRRCMFFLTSASPLAGDRRTADVQKTAPWHAPYLSTCHHCLRETSSASSWMKLAVVGRYAPLKSTTATITVDFFSSRHRKHARAPAFADTTAWMAFDDHASGLLSKRGRHDARTSNVG